MQLNVAISFYSDLLTELCRLGLNNKACRQVVFAFLFQNARVIGHGLSADLNVLKFIVPMENRRDLSQYIPIRSMANIHGHDVSTLNVLAKALFGIFHTLSPLSTLLTVQIVIVLNSLFAAEM